MRTIVASSVAVYLAKGIRITTAVVCFVRAVVGLCGHTRCQCRMFHMALRLVLRAMRAVESTAIARVLAHLKTNSAATSVSGILTTMARVIDVFHASRMQTVGMHVPMTV